MPKISKILLLAVSVVLVVTVFLGVNSNPVSAASEPQDGAYRQINVYSEVLRHIQTDYVEEPNINAVTNGALRGLLESLEELQVGNARAQGWSWQQIAHALQVSRQAVHKKYRRFGI